MRCNSPLVRGSANADLNTAMTPMIDVVFLLLVFFVWTASFQTIEYVLDSQVTSAQGTNASEPLESLPPSDFDEDIVVRIESVGGGLVWSVNRRAVQSLEDVKSRLNGLAQVDASAKVILHPDPAVELEFVIGAFDAAQLAGFTQVAFAVNAE